MKEVKFSSAKNTIKVAKHRFVESSMLPHHNIHLVQPKIGVIFDG